MALGNNGNVCIETGIAILTVTLTIIYSNKKVGNAVELASLYV